jgi:LacI family transcriptional regulator
LLLGIEDYIRSHGPWSVYLAEHGRGDKPPSWLATWKGDGIIARIENRVIASALEPLQLPIVDMSAARLVPRLPWVETDDQAIADVAAGDFIVRGLRTFGFCGEKRFEWSNAREQRFAEITRERGHACFVYTSPGKHEDGDAEIDDIARWLVKLPKPAAVFACYDARGQQVLDAARRTGLAVPEELAVLGVDNDEVLCLLSPPPLSSIIPNVQRTGWEAASVLDSMMKGKRLEGDAHLIPPIGVATRQSTDVLAVDDVQMARALRFIRERACTGIGVDDVVRNCAITRRVLETKTKALLKRTPREEIARVQTARIQELLAATDLTLAEIADRTGFRHVEYLSVFFKRETGTPPSEWRAEHQPKWRRSGSQ